jgi:NitT/TauT family transport system permease protein
MRPLSPLLIIVVLWSALWEAAARSLRGMSVVLPPLSDCIWAVASSPVVYLDHLLATLQVAMGGLALAAMIAVALAMVVECFRRARSSVLATLTILEAVPKIALAPVLTIWFGLHYTPKNHPNSILVHTSYDGWRDRRNKRSTGSIKIDGP